MDLIPPVLDMASKRSSRIFVDEAAHPHESQKSSTIPFRSRRNSRSSSNDEMVQIAKELEEGQRTNVSLREATAIARSQSASTLGSKESSTARTYESTAMSASSSASSLSSQSSEHSRAPLNGRPLNFGVVVPGVYRSSYPKAPDFEYIKGLQLKTVVTLVKKDELDHELEAFLSREGIRQVIFNMKGTKKEAIPLKTMKAILSVVLNKDNYPLMLHCNHGKHRTGCVVGVVRKLSGWDTSKVLDEYKAFAEPKARECDLDYISKFQVSTLRVSTDDGIAHSPVHVRTFFRALLFSFLVLVIWLVSGSQMRPVVREGHLLK